MPVDSQTVGYTKGKGTDVIVTPNGETITKVLITSEPLDGIGYVPHWATCPYSKYFKNKEEK